MTAQQTSSTSHKKIRCRFAGSASAAFPALAWHVVRLFCNYKGLHRLAIEDLMNTKNGTEVDWYKDQTFMILLLRKLVNAIEANDDDSDSDESDSTSPKMN